MGLTVIVNAEMIPTFYCAPESFEEFAKNTDM